MELAGLVRTTSWLRRVVGGVIELGCGGGVREIITVVLCQVFWVCVAERKGLPNCL